MRFANSITSAIREMNIIIEHNNNIKKKLMGIKFCYRKEKLETKYMTHLLNVPSVLT